MDDTTSTQPQETIQPPEATKVEQAEKPAGKGPIIGMVCGLLFGVAGITFGVIEMTKKPETTPAPTEQCKDIADDSETEDTDTKEPDTEEPQGSVDINSKDYIFIGDVGVKIKIPDSIKDVSYIYRKSTARNRNTNEGYYGSLYINGRASDDTTGMDVDYVEDFSDIFINNGGLGAVSFYADPAKCGHGTSSPVETECPMTIKVGEKTIGMRYGGIQTTFSESQTQIDWETKAADIVKSILSNPDNYSVIGY